MQPVRSRLEDVARGAGVSTMTVVRVLREPHKVAPQTRARVAAILDATQYTPDLVARALVSRRSGVVGAIVPTLSNSLIAEVVQGMSEELALTDRQMMVGASAYSAGREEALVRSFLSRRVDALYLTGSSHTAGTAKLLRAAGLPVIEGGNLADIPIDLVVGFSNVDAAAAIVTYLLERYGPAIGFIGGSPIDNDRARDRLAGYDRAMRKAGAPIDPARAIECPISMHGGRMAIGCLTGRPNPPRAVFCTSDVIASGAVLDCVRRGIAVPGDIAIAGFDDLDIAAELVPALTTVRVPRYEVGKQAAQLIHLSLGGKRPSANIFDLGFELVRRESA